MKYKEIKIKKYSKKILTFKKLLKTYKRNDENLYKVECQLRPGVRLKNIAQNTGLHEHTVKDNDLYLLQCIYNTHAHTREY